VKLQHLMYEAHEPSEKAKLFHQTADAQRGPPEATMLKLQNLLGGGVFSFVIEHVGDITHRMAQKFDWAKGQHGIVQDKVEKTLRTLESGYGFDKEMQENFESNFRFNTEQGRMPYDTFEEFEGAARGLSALYAREHSKIPVFNAPQWHARQAAIELGNWHFSKAITHLKWLLELTQDEERYDREVARVSVQEGMDNAFFMTKSISGGPTIYPLPTDAREYQDIDSKKRGGADVTVREDEGEWFHGTPEVQKLGDEFESRTFSTDYLTDPQKWLQIQEELPKHESGSDSYMNLLDAAAALRSTKKVRSPVFLSNMHAVANTYADDRRAFDYQAADAAVVPVEVAPGKTLTINGAGQNFRGIAIERVRDGLRNAGLNDKAINQAIGRFVHQIRGDGGTISTHTLSSIVDGFGFDIIDVKNIRDNYMGDGPLATVRMVMNPSLIRINR